MASFNCDFYPEMPYGKVKIINYLSQCFFPLFWRRKFMAFFKVSALMHATSWSIYAMIVFMLKIEEIDMNENQ